MAVNKSDPNEGVIFNIQTDLLGLVDELADEIPFHKVTWGKTGRTLPRKVYRVTDPMDVLEFQSLGKVVRTFEESLGRKVQGLWLNLYESGTDHCPYHRDQYQCNVASFSSGVTREFTTKRDGTGETKKLALTDGTVLYFDEQFNRTHMHSVPPRKRVTERRVSVVAFLDSR